MSRQQLSVGDEQTKKRPTETPGGLPRWSEICANTTGSTRPFPSWANRNQFALTTAARPPARSLQLPTRGIHGVDTQAGKRRKGPFQGNVNPELKKGDQDPGALQEKRLPTPPSRARGDDLHLTESSLCQISRASLPPSERAEFSECPIQSTVQEGEAGEKSKSAARPGCPFPFPLAPTPPSPISPSHLTLLSIPVAPSRFSLFLLGRNAFTLNRLV